MVRWKGRDGGYDADAWAWIDVVSRACIDDANTALLMIVDLRPWLRQVDYRDLQVHSTNVGELQTQINFRLEHLSHAHGLRWRVAFASSVGH